LRNPGIPWRNGEIEKFNVTSNKTFFAVSGSPMMQHYGGKVDTFNAFTTNSTGEVLEGHDAVRGHQKR